MWLESHGDEITFIRDYKYVRYVIADAELTFAPDALNIGGNGASVHYPR